MSPGILIIVEQHALRRSFGDPIFRRNKIRAQRGQTGGECFGKRPYLFLCRPANDGNVNVKASRSSGLNERREL